MKYYDEVLRWNINLSNKEAKYVLTRLTRLDNAVTNQSRQKQVDIQNELDSDRCPAMIAISD